MTSTTLTSDQLVAGQLVADKYVVERELGTGGFATVYAARHASVSTLRVAIKVLHAEHLDSELNRKRFRREADTVAALQSRFIVRLLDAGELQDGRPFMAMEFVDGIPLDALLKKCGRLLPPHAARFGIGVLRALEVAHAAGVVHRDLKPANVFAVEEDGEPPYSRVLDFGIAKTMDGSSVPRAGTHTMAGQVVCTPEYAAPELLSGTVTPQVDLYALGHMLAELLDGRAPYDLGTHSLLIAAEHLKPDPVPLGTFSATSGLQDVIRRACAKDPEQRYQTARQMLDDLRAAVELLPPQPTLSLTAPYVLDVHNGMTTAAAHSLDPGQPAVTTSVETSGSRVTPTYRGQAANAAPFATSTIANESVSDGTRIDSSRTLRLVIGGLAALLVISLLIVAGLLVVGPGQPPVDDQPGSLHAQPLTNTGNSPPEPSAVLPNQEQAVAEPVSPIGAAPTTAAEGSAALAVEPDSQPPIAPNEEEQGVRQLQVEAPGAGEPPSEVPAQAPTEAPNPPAQAPPETRPARAAVSRPSRPVAQRPPEEAAPATEAPAPAPANNPFDNIRAIGE